jgi:GTP pyrophosphokinase
VVFTSGARHQIKRWLNQQEKIRSSALGRKIWERESRRYALPAGLLKEENLVRRLAEVLPFKIQNSEDFFSLVGRGRIVVNKKFMTKLSPEGEPAERKQRLLRKFVNRVSGRSDSGIAIGGAPGETFHLARCCAPIRGEPIIGYMTSGRGITIHATRCALVSKEILSSERMVEVSWDSASAGSYRSRMLIRASDSPGILGKVATGIAELGGNITKAEVVTTPDKKAQIKLSLIIREMKHLEAIIRKISGIKGIISVERV